MTAEAATHQDAGAMRTFVLVQLLIVVGALRGLIRGARGVLEPNCQPAPAGASQRFEITGWRVRASTRR